VKLVLLLFRFAQPARTTESFGSKFGGSLDSRPREPLLRPEECLRRLFVLADMLGFWLLHFSL
jgi:hypothetical protein